MATASILCRHGWQRSTRFCSAAIEWHEGCRISNLAADFPKKMDHTKMCVWLFNLLMQVKKTLLAPLNPKGILLFNITPYITIQTYQQFPAKPILKLGLEGGYRKWQRLQPHFPNSGWINEEKELDSASLVKSMAISGIEDLPNRRPM